MRIRRGAAASVMVLLGPAACSTPAVEADPLLLEAIGWYTGEAGHVDTDRAHRLLEQAADDSDPLSVMWMARVHSTGRMGFERDQGRARTLAASVIEEIELAAEGGVLEAVFLMGTAYAEGLGRAEDPVQATAWHQRAAERGHLLGQHNLGNAYAAGQGVAQDPAAAVDWWTRAANRGDAITQLRLGEAYEEGNGVEQDLEAALRWYERSAESGNIQAREALERLSA